MVIWRKPLCLIYILLSLVLAGFITSIVNTHYQHSKEIASLRQDFEAFVQQKTNGGGLNAGGKCAGGGGGGGGSDTGNAVQPYSTLQQISSIVEALMNKKLSRILEDIFKIKEELKRVSCTRNDFTKETENVNSIVEEESKTCRINYADEELGARILRVDAEPVGGRRFIRSLLNFDYSSNPPINMLKSSMNPGNCFAYQSKVAIISIKLAQEIWVDAIELEHIPCRLSPSKNTKSAPKKFDVYGMKILNERNPSHLGTFIYDNLPDERIQIFHLKFVMHVAAIQIKFKSNHGHPSYTCIYRLAIYGNPEHET